MCPFFWEPLYTKVLFRGYVCQKGCPNPAPTVPLKKFGNSFCVYANDRLRRRKRLFGLTRTVARRPRSPYYNATCTVSGRLEYPISYYLNDAKKVFKRNFGSFRRHLQVVPTSPSGCSAVIYEVFRWWFRGVKYHRNDRKVTYLRVEGTSRTTHR